MDNISGINAVYMVDSGKTNLGFFGSFGSGTAGFTNLTATQAGAIQVFGAVSSIEASVKGAATNGQLDVVTMTFDDGDTTKKETITADMFLTSKNVETFNFIANDNIDFISTQEMSDWTAINVSGEGDVSLTTSFQSIVVNSVIKSTTTGNVTIDAQSSSSFGINVATGDGNDSITMANDDLSDTINTGAGDDVIFANGSGSAFLRLDAIFSSFLTDTFEGDNRSSDTITSGTGSDTIHLSLGATISTTDIDFITDLDLGALNSAVDSLVFRGIGSSTTEVVITIQDNDQANTNAQTDLQSAADFVLTNTATQDGNVTLFTYSGDSYLIVNGDGDGFYSGFSDALVKVTGVTGTLDTGDFSFT
jgi:hypothetical protein